MRDAGAFKLQLAHGKGIYDFRLRAVLTDREGAFTLRMPFFADGKRKLEGWITWEGEEDRSDGLKKAKMIQVSLVPCTTGEYDYWCKTNSRLSDMEVQYRAGGYGVVTDASGLLETERLVRLLQWSLFVSRNTKDTGIPVEEVLYSGATPDAGQDFDHGVRYLARNKGGYDRFEVLSKLGEWKVVARKYLHVLYQDVFYYAEPSV